jgi:hypothetical protein
VKTARRFSPVLSFYTWHTQISILVNDAEWFLDIILHSLMKSNESHSHTDLLNKDFNLSFLVSELASLVLILAHFYCWKNITSQSELV